MTMYQLVIPKKALNVMVALLALSLLASCGKKEDSKSASGEANTEIVRIGNGAPLTGGDSYLVKIMKMVQGLQ